MRPEEYQPPLTWWSHLWRLAIMIGLSAFVFVPRADYQFEYARWWLIADLTLGVASYVAVGWRRSYPVPIAVFTTLAEVVSATAAGPATLAMVSLATRRRLREVLPMGAIAFACGWASARYFTEPGAAEVNSVANIGIIAAVVGLLIAWGMFIGSRRELLASWQSRAQLAEAEQSAKVAQARSAERARIAREMHDVLAHRISTVNMYAGALAFRTDLTPDEVRESATVIADTSHVALTELREVLGVLRDGPGDATPESPQVRGADVDALIDENRATGMRIDYAATVDLSALPDGIGRTLYRCLQEALTNARKHAPSSKVYVRVSGGRDSGVELEVVNGLPMRTVVTPTSGFGLVGLAERVELSGGTQSHRRTADDRFVLQVWLPWQA